MRKSEGANLALLAPSPQIRWKNSEGAKAKGEIANFAVCS